MRNVSKCLLLAILTAGLSLTGCASIDALSEPRAAGLPKSLPQDWRDIPDIPHPDESVYVPSGSPASATSLWSSSPKSLFGDRRASNRGDLLTVIVEINDEAELESGSNQQRQARQGFEMPNLPGLSDIAGLSPALDLGRNSNVNGNGTISREENITLRLAALVAEVKPNGYLSIFGEQEIMVNSEIRYLQIRGLIRTEDISRINTITYDKIANARIFYGGQGMLTDVARQGSGNRLLSKILPF